MQGCTFTLTPLLTYDTTASKPMYSLQKEGLQLLKKYEHSRVRVILHYVSGQVNWQGFLARWYKNDKGDIKLQQNYLYVVGNSDNILTLVTLQDNMNLILLGYAVASMIVEHGGKSIAKNQFSQSQIVGFHKKIEKARYSECIKQSLYGGGAVEKPNFMWMFHTDGDNGGFQPDAMKNLKKQLGQDPSKSLQEVYQNITAFQMPSETSNIFGNTVDALKNHLVTKLQYRRILNFDLTGGYLQHYLYEMCDSLNDSKQSLAFDKISVKTLINLKNRVTQSVTARSVNILLEAIEKNKDTLMTPQELQEIMDISRERLRKQLSASCQFCFQLPDYLQILEESTKKMQETFKEIQKENKAKNDKHVQSLFASLQVLQIQDIPLSSISQHLLNKLTMFSQGCSDPSCLLEITVCLLKQFTNEAEQRLQSALDRCEQLEIFKEQSLHRIGVLETFNQELDRKYQNSLTGNNTSGELQSMKETLSKRQSKNNAYKKEIAELKKQLKEKDEQLYAKTNECDEFQDVITFYEGIVGTDKNRQKGKCELDRLMRNLNENIDRFHRAADKIEKLDDIIKQLKKEVDEGKEQVLRQNDRLLSEIESRKREISQLNMQKDKLEDCILKTQDTIDVYKQIIEFNKNAIDATASENAHQRIHMAQMESVLIVYKKSLELVAQHVSKSKNCGDNLAKFTKLVQEPQIKEALMKILKK